MIDQSLSSSVEEVKVVIEQTLLKVEEVFVYRIPPCRTSGGHRADDWNLANPQATCSLIVLRRDSALLIRLLAEQPKKGGPPGAQEHHLFAQCKVQLDMSSNSLDSGRSTPTQHPKPKMDYWVEPVVDSSRYFAIRISDESSGREAHVGMGFRERNDALNFKMSLQEYENTMRKEALVLENRMSDAISESSLSLSGSIGEKSSDVPFESIAAVSKLSLKDGEKIHVNLKGPGRSRSKKNQQDGNAIKPPFFLRKPPPPSSSATSTGGAAVVFNTDVFPPNRTGHSHDMSSVVALAETMDTDDDDEWGDFESVPSSGN